MSRPARATAGRERRRCRSAAAARASGPARTWSCSRSAGTCRRSSRSTRSIFARSRTVRVVPSCAANVNSPSSSYSISRSPNVRAALGFHREDTRSAMPGATADPNRWARSSPASAGASEASAGSQTSVNSASRFADRVRRDAAVSARLPLVEERLEQLVQEPAALERRARQSSSSGSSSSCSTFVA